jgi:hypothetical protein
MSLFVLVVAAGHAIPPVVGGVIGKSKIAVAIGAIVGGAIAIASGNPVFILADLVGVALGTWLGLSIVGDG